MGKEDWEMEKERNDWKERNRRGEGGEEKGKKRESISKYISNIIYNI